LVAIGAGIPVIELLVAKIFTDLIVFGENRPVSEIATSVLLLALLFGGIRLGNYAQKTYRVRFFDKAFTAGDRERSAIKESWEWAMGLELVNALIFLTQLFVIGGFFFLLNPLFALANVILIILVLQLVGTIFRKQLLNQRSFVERSRAKEVVKPFERLGSRIKQAEFSALMASFGVLLLMGLLIILSLEGVISLSNTIVCFLGLRLQNTTFAAMASSLMRFARAKANSF
jgi:uncharacterized membrane protein